MKIEMSLDKAHKVVKDVVTARRRWGRQASLPYSTEELMDALMLLSEAGNFDAPTAEEVTKLKRQLAACQNREKARLKRDVEPGQVMVGLNDGSYEIKGTGVAEESADTQD